MAQRTPSRKPRRRAAARRTPEGRVITIRLRTASRAPVQVRHLKTPPTFVRPRRIHPRRTLPVVREGMEREFHSTTERVALYRARPMFAATAATDEVVLLTNTELTSPTEQQTASNVDEPSVAMNGDVVFFTGNWYAAVSNDGGKTFQYIDPASAFRSADPPNSSFCCDQVVHYISAIDTFVWLLQYGPDTGDNIQRLAFAKTADVAQGRWRLFDITTQSLDVAGAFMDFPDLAVGANNLYVTTNIFGPGDQVGSAVIRIPFAGIDGGEVTAQHFVSTELQSFRVAQNCGTTAFFAAHHDTSTLAVFSWAEDEAAPTSKLVGIARWIGGNGYQSRTKDGRRWLDRADPRITGATVTAKDLWFAWAVDRGSNHRPNPFVQIARIDLATLTLLENINIFDTDSAICYGALSTNANDEVGTSYVIGGGPRNPSHVIGILTGARKDVVVAEGDRGPLDPESGKGEWGDYLTVRRAFPNQKLFAATGYTMKGAGDGSNRDATPRFVVFGRAGDVQPGVPLPGGGPVPPDDGQAFQDVSELSVVPSTVAAQIKGEAMVARPLAFPSQPDAMALRIVTKPGVERWPVKTGTDADVAKVGKNVINGRHLGPGIVDATVEELIRIPRPPDMTPPTQEFPLYQRNRRSPVETTVWRVEGEVIALKLEADGDYHLVVQGASGETMIAEIPTPQPPFVAASSPWSANMRTARKAVDDKLVKRLLPAAFVPVDGVLVPKEALAESPQVLSIVPSSFLGPETMDPETLPAFKTKVPPTRARITGVGFFDKVHGQMGVSQLNGIELHPVLKIEWL